MVIAIIKTVKQKRQKYCSMRSSPNVLKRLVGIVGCFFYDVVLTALFIPVTWKKSPTESFQEVARFSPGQGFLDSYSQHLHYYRMSVASFVFTSTFLAMVVVSTILISLLTFNTPKPAQAAGDSMIGFWDGGAAPTGWTCLSCSGDPGQDFYQKFIRGAAAYSAVGGGAATHTHTVSFSASGNASGIADSGNGTSSSYATTAHRHNSISSGSTVAATTFPVYQNIKVIRYDTDGTPATIPAGFIGMFDTTPPAGWTTLSSYNSDFLYGENDATGTGGAANHTHSTSITTGNNNTGSASSSDGGGAGTLAVNPHTHTGSGTTASGTHTPSYRDVILAKADADTTVPNGLITMWDATPSSPWSVISGTGGAFDSRMLRGAASYGGTGGTATHTHSNLGITTSTISSTEVSNSVADGLLSSGTHTNLITVSFGAASNLPPYLDVIIAKYSVITVSGTVRQTDESTAYNCSANNLTINVSVNGGANTSTTCTGAGGTYSVNVPVPSAAADPIVVSIDSTESVSATTVTLAADTSSNIASLDLYQNRLVVTHENAGPMTNAKLSTGDNGDAGIRYSVVSSALTVESGIELHVKSGKTFTPGNTVTTNSTGGAFHVAGTATLGTATNTIGTNISVDSGSTLTINADTVVTGGGITTTGTGNVVFSSGTPTVTLSGTGTVGGGSSALQFVNLTQNGGTTTISSNVAIQGGTLTVNTGNTISIASSKALLPSSGATVTLNGTGTISGPGTLQIEGSTLGTGGTITAPVQFFGDATMPARVYGGSVTLTGDSPTTVTLGAGTHTITGTLTLDDTGDENIIADGSGTNPTVSIGGNLDFVNDSGTSTTITAGTGTWTVSGGVDFTGGTYTATAGNTLIMDGTGTLTSAGNALQNLTLSGAVTLANATHTIARNLSLAGGTITAGTSTVAMTGTSNTITGGGKTLNNLTIDPASAGTITLQTSDLTVSGTTTVATGDTLSLDASRTLTSGTAGTVTLTGTGTISGSGTLAVQNSNLGTGGTLSAPVRFDATSGDITMPNRTYGGAVDVYSNSSSSHRIVTLAVGTHTLGSNLTLTAANTRNITLAGDTNNPTVGITGNLDFAGSGSGTEDIISGTGTWTVAGNVDLTSGNYTATAGNTLYLNGSGGLQEIIPKAQAGITFSTLRIGASEAVAMWNSSATAVTMDAGGCLLSQDHGGTDGRLNIYGACNSRANEYWSYATDFDGTALGTSRQADVRFASGASLTVDNGDTLTILGQSASANRTAITRQSSGAFSLTINGTINARYYDLDYLDASGLNIGSAATVTNLSDGSFDNNGSGATSSYITVAGITSTTTFTNMVFDATADGADAAVVYNVNADGSGINWTVAGAGGNKAGESFDREANGATVAWTGVIGTVNDGTGADSDLTNTSTQLSANWTVSDTTGVDHYEYAIGTTSGGTEVLGYTSTGLSTSVTKTGLTLTSGTTYYIAVRSINAADEVIASGVSDGITVDTTAPTFSGISTVATTTSIAITWTTSEPATTKVRYGLSTAYGTETTEDTTLATSHSVTLSGLTTGTTYHIQLLGTDQAGNTGASSDQAVATSSLEATVITNTLSTVLSSTSVRITWTTNHAADSKVRYGTTTAYGQEVYDATAVTSHAMTITGLLKNTTYHYEVLSVGNTSTNDADATFTTSAGTVENVEVPAPTIMTPAEGEIAPTTPTITGLSVSNSDVFIIVDDELAGVTKATTHTSGTGSFTFKISTPLAEGAHTLRARARNASGTVGSESPTRNFLVGTAFAAPTIIAPTENGIVRTGRPTITGLSRSNTDVFIIIDDALIGVVKATTNSNGTGNFAFQVSTPMAYDGHTVRVRARDANGNVSPESTTRHFSIEPAFPTPTIYTPIIRDGANPRVTIPGLAWPDSILTVFLNGKEIDEFSLVASAQVDILAVEDTAVSFAYTLDFPMTAGTYTVTFRARDARTGNTSGLTIPVSFTLTLLPSGSPDKITLGSDTTYYVKAGDSLWSIALLFYGDGSRWPELVAANVKRFPLLATDPGCIKPGWLLSIPSL